MSDETRQEYRTLSETEKKEMQQIKNFGNQMIEAIKAQGVSRELSLAITKIEEGVMWAVKHITR